MKRSTEPSPTNDRAARRKAQILAFARDQFLALPYSQVSVETIAALAGISKVTVYAYFDSKLEIYCAILQNDAQLLMTSFREAIDLQADLATNIFALSDAYAAFFEKHPEYFRHFSWYFLPGREERLPAAVGASIGQTFDDIHAVIEECLVSAQVSGEIEQRNFKVAASGIYAQWVGLAYLKSLNTSESGRSKKDHRLVRMEADRLLIAGLTKLSTLRASAKLRPAD